ncbi:MAG: hypothetical protein ACOCY1_05925 [Halovenus sp.]
MSDAGRNRFPETCGDCGSRFKVLKKRGPDEGSFGWNYCPHCGASLGPTYSSTSPREGQCPSCGTDGSGDDVLAMSNTPPISPTPKAHIAVCPGCENPTLVSDLCRDSAMMQCPRCGTVIRPMDISLYELAEVENAQ